MQVAGNLQNNIAAPSPSTDNFAGSMPVMTFIDPSNQPYGRYVVKEAVPVVAYTYEPVTERLYVAKTITEPQTITQTQYTPVYSYQPQLKNVSSWNPFEQPRQVWEYVPIVQYQPNYVPVTQNITYQRYELQDVTRMIPVLKPTSEQRTKYVDRPIASLPPGGSTISSVPISNTSVTNPYNVDVIQQGALVAQANRNTTRLPTRPIDYSTPNGAYNGNANYLANAPSAYYPPASNAFGYSPPVDNRYASVIPNVANSASNTMLIPAVPVQPGINGNTYPNPYPVNPYLANANQQPRYYQTASSVPIQVPAFLNRQGSLFGSDLFTNSRAMSSPGATYVASNTPVSQPYFWGPSSQSSNGFRPTTSPYSAPTQYGAPQTSWGMSPVATYRDPMQGGMQPTELR